MPGSDDLWADDGPSPSAKDELSREWDARREKFFNVRRTLSRQRLLVHACASMAGASSAAARPPPMRSPHLSLSSAAAPAPPHACDPTPACALPWQSGYREGLEEGKGAYLQQGFNAGAKHSACACTAHAHAAREAAAAPVMPR